MAYKVYLSPSDQYKNTYAWGNTNEAVQCNIIAKLCQEALKRCGFEVKQHENMYTAVDASNKWKADLHVPIHTNAFDEKEGQRPVMGTRIFCYAFNTKGHEAAKAIFKHLAPLSIGTSENIKAVGKSLYEVRETNAPCAYVECEFHDEVESAKWIVEHKTEIAEAICKGICDYFGVSYVAPSDSAQGETESDTGASTALTKAFRLPILKAGSKGHEVKTLQAYLKGMGYNIGSYGVDGDFGSSTLSAVKKLQLNNGLTQDGVVGDKTWNAILFNS